MIFLRTLGTAFALAFVGGCVFAVGGMTVAWAVGEDPGHPVLIPFVGVAAGILGLYPGVCVGIGLQRFARTHDPRFVGPERVRLSARRWAVACMLPLVGLAQLSALDNGHDRVWIVPAGIIGPGIVVACAHWRAPHICRVWSPPARPPQLMAKELAGPTTKVRRTEPS